MKTLSTLYLCFAFAGVIYAQPSDDRCTPFLVTIGDVRIDSNDGATTDSGDPACGTENLFHSVWYTFVGNGNPINISTCGNNTNFDTDIGVFSHMIDFGGCWFGQGMPGGCSSTGTPVECAFGGSNNALANAVNLSTTNGTVYYIRVSSHTSGQTGTFDFEIIDQTVAPVELVNFWAEPFEKGNTVMWETASEENVLWHVVEKSTNGIDSWKEAGKLVSTSAADRGAFYEVIDTDPYNNTYYRLRVVDYDGSEQLSDVISVKRPRPEFDISKIYPNPIMDGEVTIQIDSDRNEDIKVRIMDVSGRNVDRFEYLVRDGLNEMKVDVSDWRSGVYFIQFESRQGYSTRKIFKQE